jgi:hypothetical protein
MERQLAQLSEITQGYNAADLFASGQYQEVTMLLEPILLGNSSDGMSAHLHTAFFSLPSSASTLTKRGSNTEHRSVPSLRETQECEQSHGYFGLAARSIRHDCCQSRSDFIFLSWSPGFKSVLLSLNAI